jgi:hypothetical protein
MPTGSGGHVGMSQHDARGRGCRSQQQQVVVAMSSDASDMSVLLSRLRSQLQLHRTSGGDYCKPAAAPAAATADWQGIFAILVEVRDALRWQVAAAAASAASAGSAAVRCGTAVADDAGAVVADPCATFAALREIVCLRPVAAYVKAMVPVLFICEVMVEAAAAAAGGGGSYSTAALGAIVGEWWWRCGVRLLCAVLLL